MPIYPYSFQLPPLNVQDIPNDGAPGEFLGISAGGVLDWLPVATGGGDMLKADNLSGLTNYATARTNIGLGTASTPTFANLTLTSPSLSSSAPVTISQTWNGTGSTVFKALVVNATTPGTTSSSSSLLLDLQVGGATKFSVRKDGSPTPGTQFIGYRLTGYTNYAIAQLSGYTAICNPANGVAFFADNLYSSGAAQFLSNNIGVSIGADQSYSWKDSAFADSGTTDTILRRDGAANTLALRNGAAAQTFNVYGTSSSSNTVYERMFMRYNGGAPLAFQIGTETAGATARPLEFLTAGVKRLSLAASGSNTASLFALSNTLSNILVIRNLSEAAKFQFYLNGSGNSELYIGASNVLISETGSSYFNGGNVGIGTTSPSSKLHVAETWNNAGTAFCAIKSVITDTASAAGSDFLELYSGTSTQPLRFDVQKTGQMNIYGAWTDTSNYERLSFSAPSAANAVIGTNKAGTGTARGLEFQTDGVKRIEIQPGGNSIISNTLTVGGNINVGYLLRLASLTVSTLPAASGALFPTLVGVTDSTVTAAAGKGNTVVGGGANKVIVMSDGTNWIIL